MSTTGMLPKPAGRGPNDRNRRVECLEEELRKMKVEIWSWKKMGAEAEGRPEPCFVNPEVA